MRCGECGAETAAVVQFCVRCGAPVFGQVPVAVDRAATGLSDTGDHVGNRVRQVAWALVPIVSFTVLAWWPFLVLALIRRRARDWAVFAACLAAVAAEIVIFAVLAARVPPAPTFPVDVAALTFYAMVLLLAVAAPVYILVAFRPAAGLPRLFDRRRARAAAELDAAGIVTICKGQGLFLRADDAGVLLRKNYLGGARRIRIAWTEISHFTDGGYTKEGVTSWMLVIVLRTGKQVRVHCSALGPPDEVVAAVKKAAQPHGIPAELAGVPMKDGRPVRRGLYHDPGGQVGLRYWDGTQWSPLVPLDIVSPRRVRAQESPASWSALPTADGNWPYVAARATRLIALFAVLAAASAALVAAGLVVYHLGWDRVVTSDQGNLSTVAWIGAAACAARALGALGERRLLLKLDRAIKDGAASAIGPAARASISFLPSQVTGGIPLPADIGGPEPVTAAPPSRRTHSRRGRRSGRHGSDRDCPG